MKAFGNLTVTVFFLSAEHSFDSSESLDVTTPVQEQPGVTGNTKRPSRMDNNSTGTLLNITSCASSNGQYLGLS